MKKIKWFIGVLFLSTMLVACSRSDVKDIAMPYSSNDYETGGWTLNDLVEHLTELGFTNIKTSEYSISNYEPDEIFLIEIDSKWKGFDEGHVFSSNDKVKIKHYNFDSILTSDNCSDLEKILSGESTDYMSFANKYDGQFVEFNAHVVSSYSYLGGTSYVITVEGGDYSVDNIERQEIKIDVDSVTRGEYINKEVKEGNNVRVVGKIDESYSKYYKMLYVDAGYLDVR